jgi:hypothetical protein
VVQELHPVPPVVQSQEHPTPRDDSLTRSTLREFRLGFRGAAASTMGWPGRTRTCNIRSQSPTF